MPTLALLLSAAASAAPGGVQVQLYDDALDVAADVVEQLDPTLSEADVGAEVGCWDRVGVRDFNLDVPIDLVGLSPGADTLTLYVGFGDITGADMVLYAEDEDWTDLCAEVELDVYEIAIRDASLVGTLTLEPDGPGFAADWFSRPLVTATLESDLEAVPDDAILAFFEETILDLVAEQLEEAVPPLLDEALASAAVQGDYDDYAVDLSLVEVSLQPGSMRMEADGTVDFIGRPTCAVPPSPGAPEGRAVALPLADAGGAAFGVGLTESFANQMLHTAWRSGAFCFGSEAADVLADRLAVIVEPDIATFEVSATLGAPPVLTAAADGLSLRLRDLDLEVTGRSDSGSVSLLSARMDVDAAAAVGFSPNLTALNLSLSDLQLSFEGLAISRILPGYESHIEPIIEEQLARWLEGELQRVPVMSSLYYAYGLAIVVEDATPAEGGVELWLGLLDASTLDQTPPETEIDAVSAGRTSAEVSWSGQDDQGGPLVWSWQLDDGPWSAWTPDSAAELWALDEGAHTVRVKARDVWLNEDPTPAERSFTIDPENPSRTGESCLGCASGRGAGGGLFLAVLVSALRRRAPGERRAGSVGAG